VLFLTECLGRNSVRTTKFRLHYRPIGNFAFDFTFAEWNPKLPVTKVSALYRSNNGQSKSKQSKYCYICKILYDVYKNRIESLFLLLDITRKTKILLHKKFFAAKGSYEGTKGLRVEQ